ncbi:MAG: right-handed parallel beta-helix repeat-containing protein [Candidatus Gracilibacteria bacterium]
MKKILFLFSLLFFTQSVFATDYYVDSSVSSGGDGSYSSPWNSIDNINSFIGFKSGDHIKMKKGSNFSGNLYIIKTSGDSNNEIVYESYGEGNLPNINGMVIISGQKYITVQNLEIWGGVVGVKIKDEDGIPASNIKILNNKIHDYTDSGINIEGGGLNNITISGNEIFNGLAGVYMSSDTGDDYLNTNKKNDRPLGCNNSIKNNTIYNNKKNGIGISSTSLKEYASQFICDGSSLEKGSNVVQGNIVKDSGGYGIEIDANHILVERNIFTNNGISSSYGGCSGIHLFDRWASESGVDSDKYERGGDYNIIRYNITKENKDRQINRTDGNGILLDMWCDHNQVYNNITYNNDGAGIIAYGSSYNEIYNNTLYNNGQDVGKRFGANEMVILSADVDNKAESDVTNNEGVYKLVSKKNIIKNNIGMASKTDNLNNPNYGFIDCRYGDCRYALAVDDYVINDIGNIGNNIFSNNLWFNSQKDNQAIAIIKVSENEHFQIPIGSTNLDVWNSKNDVQNESIGNPYFVDINNANFHIQNTSPAIDNGKTISFFNDDFDGIKRPQGNSWDIGAFENIKLSPTPATVPIPIPAPILIPVSTPISSPTPTSTLIPTPAPTQYKYLNKKIIEKIDKKIGEIKGNKAKGLILLINKVKKIIKEEKNEIKKEIYQELVTYLTLKKKQIGNSYYK